MEKYQTTWDKTGNLAVDMVAACVSWNRQRLKPLKTIFLRRSYYDMFKLWVEKKRELKPDDMLQFDGVNIEVGSRLMLESLYVEYYE